MSKVMDDLDSRGGMVKPAAVLGLGPSSVRGYGEPARRTGRVLPSPDPSYSVLLVLTQRKGCTRLVIDSLVSLVSRFVIQRLGFISALKALRLGL